MTSLGGTHLWSPSRQMGWLLGFLPGMPFLHTSCATNAAHPAQSNYTMVGDQATVNAACSGLHAGPIALSPTIKVSWVWKKGEKVEKSEMTRLITFQSRCTFLNVRSFVHSKSTHTFGLNDWLLSNAIHFVFVWTFSDGHVPQATVHFCWSHLFDVTCCKCPVHLTKPVCKQVFGMTIVS